MSIHLEMQRNEGQNMNGRLGKDANIRISAILSFLHIYMMEYIFSRPYSQHARARYVSCMYVAVSVPACSCVSVSSFMLNVMYVAVSVLS